MVYPPLEAAAPPPLVQSFPAPVLTSDASTLPSFTQSLRAKPSATHSSASNAPTDDGVDASWAEALGPPLEIPIQPKVLSSLEPSFNFTASSLVSGSSSLGQTAASKVFQRFENTARDLGTTTPVLSSQQPAKVAPADTPHLPVLNSPTSEPSISVPASSAAPAAPVQPAPPSTATDPPTTPSLAPATPNAAPVPMEPADSSTIRGSSGPSFVELSADRQEYQTLERSVTAIGNVLLNYRDAQLKADRARTLALTKQVFAEGHVSLTLGQQVLEGDRLEYQLDQARGILFKPRGIINIPSAGSDFSTSTPATNATGSNPLTPLQGIQTPSPTLKATPGLQRLRFEADRIEFTANSWRAINIRITSDPFSPPELELRANQADLIHLSSREDVVKLQRPRLVFDQNISIPIPRSRIELSRQRQNPFRFDIGFDDIDRGGLYVGNTFTPINTPKFSLALTPQFFVQRALLNRSFDLLSPDVYGLNTAFRSSFSPNTTLSGFVALRTVDITSLANKMRAGLRLSQNFGRYRLDLEAAYRERVLNGSLGEQEITNRVGAILTAPTQRIGKTGLELDYRISAELLTAATDRSGIARKETLGRLQGSVSLQKVFELWKGQVLRPTATEGLKYTPEPIQPHFSLVTGFTGVFSGYTNGDTQTSLIGRVRFEGQIGHFSRPYLDYTGFFVGYSQGLQIENSPFLFDRFVDRQILSFGFLQQVYGPVRLGFQTSVNLDTGEFFNTDIILDYSRRTYGLSLRYNPNLQLGSIEFRINSFNWFSNRSPISAPEIGVVEAGVDQTNDPF